MKKQKPMIILDWEGTLFDAAGFRYDLGQVFSEAGIARKHWDDLLRKSKASGEVLRRETIAEELEKASGVKADVIKETIDREDGDSLWYLFSDVRPFLEHFKQFATLVLLSFGDPEMQARQIKEAGIEEHFDQIKLVDYPKTEVKELPVSAVHRAIFINDDIGETREMATAFRWAHHLHVNRTSGPVAADFQFPSFPDLRQLGAAITPLLDVEVGSEGADPVAD